MWHPAKYPEEDEGLDEAPPQVESVPTEEDKWTEDQGQNIEYVVQRQGGETE